MQKTLSASIFLSIALVLPAAAAEPPTTTAEPLPPASQWIPDTAVAVLEVSRPQAILDLALSPQTVEAVTSTPAFKKVSAQPNFWQVQGVVAYLQVRLGTDWKTGLSKLLGGGLTVAIAPNDTSLLILDATDQALLEKLHEVLLGFARDEATKLGQPDRVKSTQYRGVTLWTFGGEESHAMVGNRLVLSNREQLTKTVLDIRAKQGPKCLADLPAYQQAKRAAGPEAVANAFVNMATLKLNPGVQKALAGTPEPMPALLFAGLLEPLRQSNWLSLGLSVKHRLLSLQAAVDAKLSEAGAAAGFTWPGSPSDGALPNLDVPQRIAALSLYRDLHGFYAAKDKLFPERTSGLIFFENMMGIFFSGRDLTEEVLAETRPEIRFVVAQQTYDPAVGTPKIQVPAFAAVFRLKHPQQFAEVAEEAFQKAVGLVSFTSGQKAEAGLILDRPTHGDVRFTMAHYSTSRVADKTQLGLQYNFRPSLVLLGDSMVISSADGLAKDLIECLKKETSAAAKAAAGVHSIAEIDMTQIASALAVNRATLVRQNMTEKGHTEEQAEAEIEILNTILKHLGQAKLVLGSQDGQAQANIDLKLNLP